MEKIFEEKICSVCKNQNTNNCSKVVFKEIKNNYCKTYCSNYLKDEVKIEPYVAPLVVTAKRDYVERFEV